ncbi:hypothetical protein [uncultured Thioclava sp.]|jgi:hypothetical protein|uniref:50S ribosomal protein L35 n=1 Tax=Thioclava arctica TaxID=3238301 RepID=A0ABV3TH67_9RHOB|nr:hypothetical protein [uncultured Thioclava sp.]
MDLSGLDTDLILTIGLVIAIFAIPAVISAFSDQRPPRAATLAVLVSGGLILLAFYAKPGGYTIERVPDAVARTVARVFN